MPIEPEKDSIAKNNDMNVKKILEGHDLYAKLSILSSMNQDHELTDDQTIRQMKIIIKDY